MRKNARKTTFFSDKNVPVAGSLSPAVLAQVDRICIARKRSRSAVLTLIVENSPHLRVVRSHIYRVPRSTSVRIQALLDKEPTKVWRVAELVRALKITGPHIRVAASGLTRRGAVARVGPGRYVAAAGAEEARLALAGETAKTAAKAAARAAVRAAARLPPNTGFSAEIRAAAIQDYQTGERADVVCKKHGMTDSTLRRWLAAAGVPLRLGGHSSRPA